MSDVFSNLDTTGLDLSAPDISFPDVTGLTFPDLSFPSGSGGGWGAPIISPVPNLPQPAGSGISGMLGDLTSLVNNIYAGEAAVAQAKYNAQLASARQANALQTIRTTPNLWLVLGVGAAGLFALEIIDRKKK